MPYPQQQQQQQQQQQLTAVISDSSSGSTLVEWRVGGLWLWFQPPFGSVTTVICRFSLQIEQLVQLILRGSNSALLEEAARPVPLAPRMCVALAHKENVGGPALVEAKAE